jgi:hypothetical protein
MLSSNFFLIANRLLAFINTQSSFKRFCHFIPMVSLLADRIQQVFATNFADCKLSPDNKIIHALTAELESCSYFQKYKMIHGIVIRPCYKGVLRND